MQINSSASVSYHRFRVTSQFCVADTKQPVATIKQPTISAKCMRCRFRSKVSTLHRYAHWSARLTDGISG